MNSQKVTKELQAPYVSFKKKFNALALADAAKLESWSGSCANQAWASYYGLECFFNSSPRNKRQRVNE